jgi:peptidylprolyl isomerase
MKLNQTKTITIPANQAYGEINPALFIEVPLSAFGNHTVQVGMAVTNPNGQQGIITGLNSTTATVDFNPQLAGQNLTFTIKVIRIRAG